MVNLQERRSTMAKIGRQSAISLGLVTAAAPALGVLRTAAAETYRPDQGKELFPGVRQVDLSQRDAVIPGYQTVSMRDIVFQPGASVPVHPMENDMVCHITEGELKVVLDGQEFTAAKNDVYTCATGTQEGAENTGETVAIMRVTDLLRG
jgi:quercetin dioxygenase-like cupin family protein